MKSLHSWSHPLLSLHVIYLSSITMMSPRHVNHMPFSGVWSLKLVWQSSVTINPKVETGKGRKKRIGWPGETRKQMGQWDWKWKETWVGLKMGLGPNRQADKGPDFSRAVSFLRCCHNWKDCSHLAKVLNKATYRIHRQNSSLRLYDEYCKVKWPTGGYLKVQYVRDMWDFSWKT